MSVKEALGYYTRSATTVDASASRTQFLAPVSSNQTFLLDRQPAFDPNLLRSYGEECVAGKMQADHHVLICLRRFFLITPESEPITFPPYDEEVRDVLVEKVGESDLLVLVGLETGVEAILTNLVSRATHSEFIATNKGVSRIHRLTKDTFALCLENCSLRVLSVSTDEETGAVALAVSNDRQGWRGAASSFWSPKAHKDSFVDTERGHILVLSNQDVALWSLRSESASTVTPTLSCSTPVKGDEAVLLPISLDGEEQGIAVVVLRNGTRLPLYGTRKESRQGGATTVLTWGTETRLPDGARVSSVCYAARGAGGVVLYDDLTTSLILIAEMDPFTADGGDIVSLVNLGKKACGVSFHSTDKTSSGMFWVYGARTSVLQAGCLSRGQRVLEAFSKGRFETLQFLSGLGPQKQADLLLDAMLEGLPLEETARLFGRLMQPFFVSAAEATVSPGGVSVTRQVMRRIDVLCRLCALRPSWQLHEDLNKARKQVHELCEHLRKLLTSGAWLDFPATSHVAWSPDLHMQPSCSTSATPASLGESSAATLTLRTATNAQAELLSTLLASADAAATTSWLYVLLHEDPAYKGLPFSLRQALWTADIDEVNEQLCMELLSLDSVHVVQQLLDERERLSVKVQLLARLHGHLLTTEADKALQVALDNLADIRHAQLLPTVCALLEHSAPELLPSVRLLMRYYDLDPSSANTLLGLLGSLPHLHELHDCLTCVFSAIGAPAIQSIVLDWMEGYPLDDPRVETFATVVAELQVPVDPAPTLTGTFFSCWSQEVNGSKAAAARRFGELASSSAVVPLTMRLVCLEHAMACDPTDGERICQFMLLLQEQLVHLLRQHLLSDKELLRPRNVMEEEVTGLWEQVLPERELFELAGRYRELGGASVQLDILKIHSDAPERVTADVVVGVLTFLRAIDLSAAEAVTRVLKEYLPTFQAPLPLTPFLEFLAFDQLSADQVVAIFADCGVTPVAAFDVFLSLIDGRGEPMFPVGSTVDALTQITASVSEEQRDMCAAHLLECIRGLLAGEYRTVALVAEDHATLHAAEGRLRQLVLRRA